MTKIGFIGLGNMGLPMATNLIKAGFEVTAFDLQAAPLECIKSLGGNVASDATEVCIGADAVISMLPAGKHVEALYIGDNENGLLYKAQKDSLFIDCSTIDSETAIKVHQCANGLGVRFIDAPVSGGVVAAAGASLTFMCGGETNNFFASKPVLEKMGLNIFHAGAKGAGQVAKMCNNMLLAIHMIGTAEALKLGENNGLSAKTLSQIMLSSSGKNWSLEKYNPYPEVMEGAPASNDYQPGFMVDLMTKDLNLAINNAHSTDSKTPLGETALKLYQQKQSQGDGQLDFSSIIQLLD